ncbi:wax ester/triacylglycerol synthase domain-containing protein [Geodermatophilus sp. SYSU D00758]
MSDDRSERPLSLQELANVWVDEPSAPFQIALVGVFDAGPFSGADGSVDTTRVRSELARRARTVPALRRQVRWPRPGRGRPRWTADLHPSPERRITVASLPPGADFLAWCAQEVVRPLDLAGPPWRAVVVDGLEGNRFALLVVVHHVLADGLTGVAIVGALLDPTPAGRADEPVPVAQPARPATGGRAVGTSADRVLRRVRGAPDRLRRGRRRVADAAADFRTRAPLTSLSHPLGPHRRLVVVQQPLADLRSAGHRLGATVNDLLLAAVTGGLRELLLGRGDELPAVGLRASMPVGSRGAGQPDGILLVDLPVAEPDPLRRLAVIREDTARLKARMRSGGGDVLDVLHLPLPAARLAVRWMRRIAGGRLNLFITDVPGPAEPLWLAGARMLEAYPVAPLVHGLPLGVAALSYAGVLHVSTNADAAVDDLEVLATGMRRSFAELLAAAGPGARLPAPAPRW